MWLKIAGFAERRSCDVGNRDFDERFRGACRNPRRRWLGFR